MAVNQVSTALDTSPEPLPTALDNAPEPLSNALDDEPMSDAARFLAPTRRWPDRKPKPPRPEPTETGRTIWIGG